MNRLLQELFRSLNPRRIVRSPVWNRKRNFFEEECLAEHFLLDKPLFNLSRYDAFTIADACEGVVILGATGSGKTSGSGATLARSYLKAGFGGLVLTAKQEEAENWERYLQQAGREDDFVRFAPNGPWRFNFLDYELNRKGKGGGKTHNIAQLFIQVAELKQRGESGGGGENTYWRDAMRQMLNNAIDLLSLARGRIVLDDLMQIVLSSAMSPEQIFDPDWRKKSFCWQLLQEAGEKEEEELLSPGRKLDLAITRRYWLDELPKLSDRTRSNIISTFTSVADIFLRGELRELFCTDTTLTPEAAQDGQVIVVDLPVKLYGDLGQYAQVLFKYMFQKATEQRDTNINPRPVFVWADEAQLFINSYDREFMTTARSSRACNVYLTQNISNFMSVLPSGRAQAQTHSLLGNMTTKIFHANADTVTNKWAAELIGQSWHIKKNTTQGRTEHELTLEDEIFYGLSPDRVAPHPTNTESVSRTQHFTWDLPPQAFTRLAKGGAAANFKVESIVMQAGRTWGVSRKNYLKVRFAQK